LYRSEQPDVPHLDNEVREYLAGVAQRSAHASASPCLLVKVANRAEIRRKVTPHVLRHTFAVTAIQKGISLPALQRLLGHDRLTTTEIYLNLSPEEVLREFRAKW
jgi:site-specific recombinase XerD